MQLQLQAYTPDELDEFATHLQALKELIDFFYSERLKGRSPDIEPMLKLMNCLIDLYQ